jgi:hypothetical protein
MSDDRVIHNGMEMAADWPARIEAAQQVPSYAIDGAKYPRVRYGGEDGGPFPEPCHDCGVQLGQYHVEFVCDMEQCPRCGGQVIGCDCPYDSDAPEDQAASARDEAPPPSPVVMAELLVRIRPDVEGCSLFCEVANGRLQPLQPDSLPSDAAAIVVTFVRKGLRGWESEEPARQLSERLRDRWGLSPLVLISRDPDSFVGYYVRVAP